MSGNSPNDLSLACSWLRRRRIYDASQLFDPGSVRRPERPYLKPCVWADAIPHHQRQLASLDLTIPPVFTRTQSYVVGALMFIWDSQGPEAQFTYEMLYRIIFTLIMIDSERCSRINRRTVTQVLYMFHESGAAKYVPGFRGVKSSITLVDIDKLYDLFPIRHQHRISYPAPAPNPGPLSNPRSAPTPGSLEGTFCRHGYWSLLAEVYAAAGSASAVTREFNKQLRMNGLTGYRAREYLPKLHYPTQTWYVNSTDENNWRVQAAVNATRDRFLPSQSNAKPTEHQKHLFPPPEQQAEHTEPASGKSIDYPGVINVLGPFAKGSIPSQPLVVDLANDSGVLDLGLYDDITIEGDNLPDGTLEVLDQGRIRYTFTSPFTKAGRVCLRVRLERTGQDIDYTPLFGFDVLDNMPVAIITPDEAYFIASEPVSAASLYRAQVVIGLVINRDLSDATWFTALSDRDKQRLRTAVAFQALYSTQGSGSPDLVGVKSVIVGSRLGGESITWQDGMTTEDYLLSPLTKMALSKLSWLRNSRTLKAKPMSYTEPVAWTNDNIFMSPIVRPPLADEFYWQPMGWW